MIDKYTVKHNIETLQLSNKKVELPVIEDAVNTLVVLFDCLDSAFKKMDVYKDNNSNRPSNILDYTKKITKGLEGTTSLFEENSFHESDANYEISKYVSLGFNKAVKDLKAISKISCKYDRRLQCYVCKSVISTKRTDLKISLSWQRSSSYTHFNLTCKLG